MRRFSQRKKSKLGIFLASFVLILLILILLVFKSAFFNIKKIEISLDKNSDCINVDQLKNTSGILNKNIFFISSLNTEKNIKEKFVCIKKVTFSKNFPDKVKLSLLGRESKGKLLNLSNEATVSASLENLATPSAKQSQDDTYLIDDEIIFSKDTKQLSVPKIYLSNLNLSLGKKLDSSLKKTLNILEKLKTLGLNIQTTQINAQYFVIFPEELQPKIIFSLEKDINAQIASLQLILEKAKIDKESVEFINLRFDKPVVKFAPKKK